MVASTPASRNATFVSIAITVVTSRGKRIRLRCLPRFLVTSETEGRNVPRASKSKSARECVQSFFWHAGLEDYFDIASTATLWVSPPSAYPEPQDDVTVCSDWFAEPAPLTVYGNRSRLWGRTGVRKCDRDVNADILQQLRQGLAHRPLSETACGAAPLATAVRHQPNSSPSAAS